MLKFAARHVHREMTKKAKYQLIIRQKSKADFTVGNIYLLTNISEGTAFFL